MKWSFNLIEFGTPDYDESIQLRTEILRKPLKLEFTAEDLSEEWNQYHLVGYDTINQIVAVLVFKRINSDVLKMRQVAVKESFQGSGLGSQLVHFAEKWAIEHHYKQIELHARKSAVSFYLKLAYHIEGEEFMEVNLPHHRMIKNLDGK